MKLLNVPYFNLYGNKLSTDAVSALLDDVEKENIALAPWPDYGYIPEVAFSIAYTEAALLVKFYVSERHLQAVYHRTNDPVHKDSCVEFFIAFDNDATYYNLEFNSIGACLAGYGESREDRLILPASIIRNIRHQTFIRGAGADGLINWEMTLIIPKEVFCHHTFAAFGEQSCRVNFYKCGDDLPEPHFLAWNAITAEKPDFHLPQYFGKMQFNWS